jgi:hypothetical protein
VVDLPSRLDDARLAVAVVLTSTTPARNVTVNLPLAVPSVTLTAIVVAALGAPWSTAGGADFGVRRVVSGTTWMVELGADTALVPLPTIASATAVQLPPPAPTAVTNASACTFFNPYMAPFPGSAAAATFAAPPATPAAGPVPVNLAPYIATFSVAIADPAAAAPVAATAPGGAWRMVTSNSWVACTLPANASAALVHQCVSSFASITSTTLQTYREGVYMAQVWNVTGFFTGIAITPTPGPGAPPNSILTTEIRPSYAVNGTVRVSLGGRCEHAELSMGGNLDEPMEQMRSDVGALPHVTAAPYWRSNPSKGYSDGFNFLNVLADPFKSAFAGLPMSAQVIDTRAMSTVDALVRGTRVTALA